MAYQNRWVLSSVGIEVGSGGKRVGVYGVKKGDKKEGERWYG